MDEHKLSKLTLTTPRSAEWLCTCGASGSSTRATQSENLMEKTRSSWRKHRHAELSKVGVR